MIRGTFVCAALLALAMSAQGVEPKAGMKEAGKLEQFVIEREIEGAGQLTADELRDISRRSRAVLEQMGSGIQWVQSYVVDDKVYCVYNAEDAELIRHHAEQGGFPANKISVVRNVIDPSTAD
jgi:hypothetical protein